MELNFNLSLSLMRWPISGLKLGLYCFLLPLGVCALSVLVMTEFNCAIDVSMLVIGMELKMRNCCSVYSMNDVQFVLL